MNIDARYEIVYILSVDKVSVEEACQSIRTDFEALHIRIEHEDDMGVRKFTYPIAKNSNGHYYVFTVHMSPETAHALGNHYKHNNTVLRHLIIRKGR